jgi:2-amino-4-hydroxy-6-hydroxymethyldihydropteridine diphosphokinase
VPRAYIALGANLGDARANLLRAMEAMGGLPRTSIQHRSSLYRSSPVDSGGPDYINAVVEVETAYSPLELLHALQRIEQGAGRLRPYHNAPRSLDLDILLYGEEHLDTIELKLPHPRMFERAFVLLPLAEIAPQLVTPAQLHKVQGQSIERLA